MDSTTISILLLSILLWSAGVQRGDSCSNNHPTNPRHTAISNTQCSRFYSHSAFPNIVSSSLSEASNSVAIYLKAAGGCSSHAHLYFCLSLMPRSSDNTQPASYEPPCRSFCEVISASCSNAANRDLDTLGACLFSDCSRFPSEGCIGENHTLVQHPIAPMTSTEAETMATSPDPPTPLTTTTITSSITPSSSLSPSLSTCPPLNATFYTTSSKSFAVGWISFWSVLCFLSTSLTLLTFLLDMSRFHYPWRPVVYLALVFNVHSLTYFFSLALGRRIVTCPGGDFVDAGASWTWAHTPCLLVFIFLYYTVMAAFIWWVVLTICWLLVAALKWSHEAVSKFAPLYHIAAWVLPLLMTIGLLASRVVGADELTATCFVVSNGTHQTFLALLLGVILPLVLLLLTGVVFVLIGFVSIIRVRAFMQQGGKQEEQQTLEKLMIRIGIYVSIYIVPAAVFIACFVYELSSRSSWQPLGQPCSSCSRPNSAVFMLRIVMFLLIGVLTGVWIWSRKTLKSWQQCPAKCVACCSPPAAEQEIKMSMDTPAPLAADNILSQQQMPSYSYPDSGLDSI